MPRFRDLRRTFGALARATAAAKDDVASVLGNTAHTNFVLGVTCMPPSSTTPPAPSRA